MAMDEIKENDLVALVTPRPEVGLKRGDVGTVIHVFDGTPDHPSGFIVEFVDETGEVLGQTDITDPSHVVKLRLDPKGTLEEWAGNTHLLAIVFTDIIGSSALGQELGDRSWFDLLEKHFITARRITHTYDGHEINVIGDSYMVAFRSVVAAFDFVIAFQEDTGDERIRIRAGLHVGSARVVDDDILGINDDILGFMVHYKPRDQYWSSYSPRLVLSSEAKKCLEYEQSKYWWLNFKEEEVSFPGVPQAWTLWYVSGSNLSLRNNSSRKG